MPLIESISGIRGTIGGKVKESLTPIDIVTHVTRYASYLQHIHLFSKQNYLFLGRDTRISGQAIHGIVRNTLQLCGIHVVDLELTTTPTLSLMIAYSQNAWGGIMITASHNPYNWNALKLFNKEGSCMNQEELKAIKKRPIQNYHFADTQAIGTYRIQKNAIAKHVEKIKELPLVHLEKIKQANFKVAIDTVNSSGSIALPILLEALGVKTITRIFEAQTGIFERNPEPIAKNLKILQNHMQHYGPYDIGFAVDPDVDRLVILDEKGTIISEEYTLAMIADYVLTHQKGSVVSTESSSQIVRKISEKHGVQYIASAVGEPNVVITMQKHQAVIGGEGNGGIIEPSLHYGRDALVGIALFLSYLTKEKTTVSEIRRKYSNYFMVKEKIILPSNETQKLIFQKLKEQYYQYKISEIDGLKVELTEDTWFSVRKSNTENILRIYAESNTLNKAKKMMQELQEIMYNI